MSSFKKLDIKVYPKTGPEITPDYVYWKKLRDPVLVKEFGPIDYIDFSPIEPYHFAVTCSVRVQVYNPITKLVVKNLSRFRENAHGATFRSDGKLICAGGDEGAIKLFDVSTKSMLRLFKGHEGPVYRTFCAHNRPQITSFSDDKTVRIWDIPTEKNLITFAEHTDYIRAGALNPNLPDLVLSGSYDGTVKLYDTRMEKLILSVNHGHPVESVLFLPAGGVFLSAGGTCIKIWDTISKGKLIGTISQHHKTITSMQLASNNNRLLSAGLDRHVKIYDISTYKVVHTMDYPNAILSLGVSKTDDTVVAGLVDGLVCVSRMEDKDKIDKKEKKKVSQKYKSFTHNEKVDVIIEDENVEKISRYDYYLKKFQYSKALDEVLRPYFVNKTPEITVEVIMELLRRKALERVFKDRDNKFLIQILKFFNKNITDYRFTRVLIIAFNVFLDVYQDRINTMPMEVLTYFNFLNQKLKEEVDLGEKLGELAGCMSMLLVAGDTTSSNENGYELKNLVASADAQKDLIVQIS
ncbi:U3 small nucleolar RNA-associated protein 15 homolog [Onthophagus taurus]|uniref:U3 small nucleolar RNA-associated protein 15 homolog n=1 Tax=Onthophagus taurus TaxID=166361 RepID=UPI0039BDC136